MSCIDCGGGTPGPLWKRCEDHAMAKLRTLMGGAPPPSVIVRKYRTFSKVRVLVEGERLLGRVARCPQANQYVIDLERGGRVYVNASALSPP